MSNDTKFEYTEEEKRDCLTDIYFCMSPINRFDEVEPNGRCPKCGRLTYNGKAMCYCTESPVVCKECRASVCKGFC